MPRPAHLEHSISETDWLTVLIGAQAFGIPVAEIHDVFVVRSLTRVPLAQPEVAGLLNLRGRIITMIDMRARLGLPRRESRTPPKAVGFEICGDAYGLIVDEALDVEQVSTAGLEPNPPNMDPKWRAISRGIYRRNGMLRIALDVGRILDPA